MVSCNSSNSTVFEKGKSYLIISNTDTKGQIKVISIKEDWVYVEYTPYEHSGSFDKKFKGNTYFNIHNIGVIKKIE